MSKTTFIVNSRISSLNAEITKTKPEHLKYPEYSFAKIVSSYYDISPVTESMVLYVLKDILNDYAKLFGSCSIENIVLGALLYVTDEYDITKFINILYKAENIKKNTIQIYYITNQLDSICGNVESGLLA
jgi:hypothetical protein